MSSENIEAYMKQLPDLKRYQNAFQHIWNLALENRTPVDRDPSLLDIATLLIRLNVLNKNHARNCYSALLLIPGFEHLRFSPLLKQCKRIWNQAVPKYPAFYSATDLIQRLIRLPLNWTSPREVRDRLIICWRLIQLTRSIDLARMYRKVSFLQGKPYIFIQRKGWLEPRWEEVVCLPNQPAICPWSLLKAYVTLTPLVPAGTPVLRTLHSPYLALSSNTIGSLTSKMLSSLGLPKGVWGAHSTRGAGVTMYKELGLSSEQVCEIGKWKNTGAFTSHYLRLGAPSSAREKIEEMVHSVSLVGSAMSDWSRTPGSPSDPGGSDQEGRAQTTNEPAPSRPKRKQSPDPHPVKFQFAAQRHRQPPSNKQ